MQTVFLAQGGARGTAPAVGGGAQLEHTGQTHDYVHVSTETMGIRIL